MSRLKTVAVITLDELRVNRNAVSKAKGTVYSMVNLQGAARLFFGTVGHTAAHSGELPGENVFEAGVDYIVFDDISFSYLLRGEDDELFDRLADLKRGERVTLYCTLLADQRLRGAYSWRVDELVSSIPVDKRGKAAK